MIFKSRLLQYEADLKEGKKLSEQQIEARFCIGEVETQLEFLKDISRILQSLQKEYLRGIKQRDDGMKKDVSWFKFFCVTLQVYSIMMLHPYFSFIPYKFSI